MYSGKSLSELADIEDGAIRAKAYLAWVGSEEQLIFETHDAEQWQVIADEHSGDDRRTAAKIARVLRELNGLV